MTFFRQFYPNFDAQDQVRAYAIYGGTLAYLNTLQSSKSLADNILDGILSRGSFLNDEVRFLLQQELREPRNYFAFCKPLLPEKPA